MADLVSPTTFAVVLVPVTHTTTDGCKPGFVHLTGTPGEGSWEQWGPYRLVGEVTEELSALAFSVPLPDPATAPVPSVSSP